MSRPSILVIDNYDSFVYNLVQYLAELGADVTVKRNDDIEAEDIAGLTADGVLVSPGPGHPRDAGNCISIIRYCAEHHIPMFGVCLGHQALAESFGGSVVSAPELLHGRASIVTHDSEGIFRGVKNPLIAGRYHSLVVQESDLPEVFVVSARSNGLIMGMRHRELDLEGVQFHPESVLTEDGYLMLSNWLERCSGNSTMQLAEKLSARADDIRHALPQPQA